MTWPTEQAREAVQQALAQHEVVWIDHEVGWDCGCNEHGTLPGMPQREDALAHQTDAILAALAPHVAALVRAERAAAVREAAESVPPGPHPNGCLAVHCGECARRYERDALRDLLRDRAEDEEAGR